MWILSILQAIYKGQENVFVCDEQNEIDNNYKKPRETEGEYVVREYVCVCNRQKERKRKESELVREETSMCSMCTESKRQKDRIFFC